MRQIVLIEFKQQQNDNTPLLKGGKTLCSFFSNPNDTTKYRKFSPRPPPPTEYQYKLPLCLIF